MIRVLLADDHQIVLKGLRCLLDRQGGIEVVGETRNGRASVRRARELTPDVVLMDLAMPGLSGIEATRQIHTEMPQVRVLCLSMHGERRFVAAALEAGAAGYLLKHCAPDELTLAIGEVAAGRSYLSPAVAAMVVDDYAGYLSGRAPSRRRLTGREREVLQLLAEGGSTRDIAARLHLSVKTVGRHRDRIKDKLGIRSIAGLTKYAIRHALTTEARDLDV